MKALRDEIRTKYPTRAARSVKSAKSAIRLFCIECCGGDAGDARRCQVKDCFLWPHVKAWRNANASEIEVLDAADNDSPDASEFEAVEESDSEALDAAESLPSVGSCAHCGLASTTHPNSACPHGYEAKETAERRPPPPRAREVKEQGPVLDRTPGALVGRTLRRVESDGTVRECVVTERGFEYGGAVYTSISAAAKVASGRKAANGWEYWR